MKLTSPKLRFLIFLILFVPGAAFTQAIALAPAQIVEDFKPGVPFEYSLAVANNGSQPVELHVQITDLWFNDKNEKARIGIYIVYMKVFNLNGDVKEYKKTCVVAGKL